MPLLALAAVLLPPLALRALELRVQQAELAWTDLRGLAADATVALFFFAFLVAVALVPAGRGLAALAATLWGGLHYANYEHIVALGTMLNLSYAGYAADPTFFWGSMLHPTAPLGALLVLALPPLLVWPAFRRPPHWPLAATTAGAGLVLATALAFTPADEAVAGWRQTHFLAHPSRSWVGGTSGIDDGSVLPERTADLSGRPLLAPAPRARNVLLVILEGLSGAYLPTLRATHGLDNETVLPHLEAFARNVLAYDHFLSLQRQTNRGEYAILCGDSPKLLTAAPKMTELAGRGPLPCLPALLREAGYATVYLQAAPLPFMLKDQFMRQAGFEQVHGDEWFSRHFARTEWGIDDRAFLDQSLAMIDGLESGDRPWFLTLLTVGTHHPYTAPASYRGRYEPGTFGWAAEYLDQAVGELLEALRARSVFEDTLVILTSDESNGIQGDVDDLTRLLSQAFGLLLVHEPQGTARLIAEPFSQQDLPLSILDYLGLDEAARRFPGRSVFRTYTLGAAGEGREIAFANTYFGALALLAPDDDVVVCTERFSDCVQFETPPGSLFSPLRRKKPLEETKVERLRRLGQASLETAVGATTEPGTTWRLLADPVHALIPNPRVQFVFGGQFLEAAVGMRIDVDLVVELRGSEGHAVLSHDLTSRQQDPLYARPRLLLHPGEVLTLRYSVVAPQDLDRIECRLWVEELEGQGLSLLFREATMRRTPGSDGDVPATVQEREAHVDSPQRAPNRGLER